MTNKQLIPKYGIGDKIKQFLKDARDIINKSRGVVDMTFGRDHTLGWGIDDNGIIKDDMWPFGGNPETYVITTPDQASLLIGNYGMFNGPAYSRKKGGKLIPKKSCK